ncbi:MAG TPA: cation transporter [Myxococcales bacterium]|nr:cation transporter [Myxococcales bacterium]
MPARQVHAHVAPRVVLLAMAATMAAALVELVASWRSGSLFLAADAVHLLAHMAIFLVLLIPPAAWHDRGEDLATICVVILVLLIAAGIGFVSVRALVAAPREPPPPAFFLVSLTGLSANMLTAFLFRHPSEEHWSFRAALAHELSDAALTIVGLAGALAIKLFALREVDPGLSLAIAAWLLLWAGRLAIRRIRLGPAAWRMDLR